MFERSRETTESMLEKAAKAAAAEGPAKAKA
jgi:hypothetical protein